MAANKELEIAPQTTSNKIVLADADYALYQTLKELIDSINRLERRLNYINLK